MKFKSFKIIVLGLFAIAFIGVSAHAADSKPVKASSEMQKMDMGEAKSSCMDDGKECKACAKEGHKKCDSKMKHCDCAEMKGHKKHTKHKDGK